MKRIILVLCLVLCVVACENPYKTMLGTGEGTMKYSPITVSDIDYIIPMGGLSAPGHIVPTDHIYFYFNQVNSGDMVPVYAPASGVVISIMQPESDYKIEVMMSNSRIYYMDHILPKSGTKVGTYFEAGETVGTTSGYSSMDLGYINFEYTNPNVANPLRYADAMLYTDSPIKYYEEPLRTQLYAKVNRAGSDKDGQHFYDEAGKLVGNWHLEGTPYSESDSYLIYAKQLSFVYDNFIPTRLRIGIGGTIVQQAKIYATASGDPDPASVTAATGKVSYNLYAPGSNDTADDSSTQLGLVIAQVLTDTTIKVEYFDSNNLSATDFTSNAKTYER